MLQVKCNEVTERKAHYESKYLVKIEYLSIKEVLVFKRKHVDVEEVKMHMSLNEHGGHNGGRR